MLEFIKREAATQRDLPKGAGDESCARVAALDAQKGGANADETRAEIQRTMQAHCGVFRFPDLLVEGVAKIKAVGDAVAQPGDRRQEPGLQHRAHRGARAARTSTRWRARR